MASTVMTPEEIDNLIAENANLRHQLQDQSETDKEKKPSALRRILSIVLAILAIVAIVASVDAIWLKTTLQDEDQFVSTFEELIVHEDVATALSIRIADGIIEATDAEVFITNTPTIAERAGRTLKEGHSLGLAGNGGATALASHMASELITEFARLPGSQGSIVDLSGSAPILTGLSNDFGFDHAMALASRVLLTPGSAVFLFSTSGESRNLVEVARECNDRGIWTVGLIGSEDSELGSTCSEQLVLRAATPGIAQDYMSIAVHVLTQSIVDHSGRTR